MLEKIVGGFTMLRTSGIHARLFGLLLCLFTGTSAFPADFYAGKTIRIAVGGDSGGGHDVHARLIAAYFGKYLPGNPSIVVQGMPGAGGVTAANYIFNAASKDGLEIGLFNRDALLLPLLDPNSARFRPERFNWIGTPASYADDAYLIVVRSGLGYRTMDDVRKASPPLNIAHHGTPLIPLVKEGLGASAKIITGYRGSSEAILAFQRNEVDGIGASYVNLMRRFPDWVSTDKVRVIVQYGHETRLDGLPDVPTARELARTPDDLALIKLTELPLTFGFPIAAPSETPTDRVQELRRAFSSVMQDPGYRAAIEKAGVEFSPRSGEDLAADIKDVMGVRPDVVARYRLITSESAGGN